MDPTPTSTRQPRHDGWTEDRKMRFLDCLAQSGNVRVACSQVGLTREAAYRLKRREPLFERGWAAALAKARDLSIDALAERAVEGVEEPIYYRGELVGTRRRYDSRLLLAHIARLDKLVDERAVRRDAARFDELLAVIGRQHAPADLYDEDEALPLPRREAAERLARQAQLCREWDIEDARADSCDEDGDHAGSPARPDGRDDLFTEEEEEQCAEAYEAGREEAEELWDDWFGSACDYVDWASNRLPAPPEEERAEEEPSAAEPAEECSANERLAEERPAQTSIPRALARDLAAAMQGAEKPAEFSSRTMCTSSTSALALALSGGATGFPPPTPKSPFSQRHR